MLSATILLSILKLKRHNSNTSKQNALVAEQKCTNRKKTNFQMKIGPLFTWHISYVNTAILLAILLNLYL